jgi:hypothetical protein
MLRNAVATKKLCITTMTVFTLLEEILHYHAGCHTKHRDPVCEMLRFYCKTGGADGNHPAEWGLQN